MSWRSCAEGYGLPLVRLRAVDSISLCARSVRPPPTCRPVIGLPFPQDPDPAARIAAVHPTPAVRQARRPCRPGLPFMDQMPRPVVPKAQVPHCRTALAAEKLFVDAPGNATRQAAPQRGQARLGRGSAAGAEHGGPRQALPGRARPFPCLRADEGAVVPVGDGGETGSNPAIESSCRCRARLRSTLWRRDAALQSSAATASTFWCFRSPFAQMPPSQVMEGSNRIASEPRRLRALFRLGQDRVIEVRGVGRFLRPSDHAGFTD